MLAVGLAIGLFVYPQAELEEIRGLGRLLGLAGVMLMSAAMVIGVPRAVWWAAVLLLAQYGTSLVSRAGVDSGVPVYTAILFLMVELAFTSLERRRRIPGPTGMSLGRVARLLGLGVIAWGTASLVAVLALVPVEYGLLVQVAGVGAAAAVLTTLIMLVRRRA